MLLKRERNLISDWLRSDVLPDLVFDVRSRRWLYRDSRQFAPMQAVRVQAERYRNAQQLELTRLGSKYTKGEISLKQFQIDAAQALKGIHLAEMIRALDRQDQATAERFLLIARNLQQQYYRGKDPLTGDRYGLKYLFKDVVEGRVSPGQLENRLRMFGESGKVSYWGIKANIALETMSEARRLLAPAEHCANCLEYARRGWQSIADTILPTQACQCRSNCKCTLEFR